MKKYIAATITALIFGAPTIYLAVMAETATDGAIAVMFPIVMATALIVSGGRSVDRMRETAERAVLLRWLRDMGWSAARKGDEGFAGWCIGLARHIEQGAHHTYVEALADLAKAEPPSQAEVESAGKDGGA